MADDLIDRLRAEETRMCRLHDAAVTYRDKHRGEAFADLNALKHAIAGRDPVLAEAAAEIGRLRAALAAAEAERDRAMHACEGDFELSDANAAWKRKTKYTHHQSAPDTGEGA